MLREICRGTRKGAASEVREDVAGSFWSEHGVSGLCTAIETYNDARVACLRSKVINHFAFAFVASIGPDNHCCAFAHFVRSLKRSRGFFFS
jgi:hypothetical protein